MVGFLLLGSPLLYPCFFEAWILAVGSARGRLMLRWSFVAAIQVLWKERNLRQLKGYSFLIYVLCNMEKFLVALWASCSPPFTRIPLYQILKSWNEIAFSSNLPSLCTSAWLPPPTSCFKLDFGEHAIGIPACWQ